ncbi:cell envelope integrity protein CreD [Echinicola vietnamensis]|uniref:Inner membrane protein involved in colicin E2 resistance n=1 Tax=Echinicola vietnamensis (strain DSM 17526 / LMG 23754 / KMM 6221) TaxID=926556 RepID=L0FXD0_ECHVK|nr:cell envelope integrity protein CreD [Echinicola vietnamensis]AGA77703.1 Inner membrane protein involved in colicin E2 resistance [Echinicola vietnamensis DSM 17526]
MKNENTYLEKLGAWISNSVSLKLLVITILVLLLLIPSSMIMDLISEREALNEQTKAEVSSKWANSQQVNGPVLTVPLLYEYHDKEEIREEIKYLYLLPEQLQVDGKITPETLRRGIYEVVVYTSHLVFAGDFQLQENFSRNNLKEIQYDKAFLTIGISDLRGIKEELVVNWGGEQLQVKPGSKIPALIHQGISVDLPHLDLMKGKKIPFSFALNLQGSRSMSFVPVGGTTEIQLTSPWSSPSFSGNFLPDQREVTNVGFTANWKVLQLNRNFPQFWVDESQGGNLQAAAFGVDLLFPVDNYQKSMRSAKYAVMTIVVTFLVFFLVEVLNKRKIHPFQYALVGLGLCLFYVLLVSITEHSDFNTAYAMATLGIVSMIVLYSLTVFKKKMLSLLLLAALAGAFGFLYVTLQLTDYALLMGSIGLTVMLAMTMYFTRNIDWYQLSIGKQEDK